MAVSKYRSKKVEIDGIVFDSKSEGEYYLLLKHLKEEGIIKDFSLQPAYILQEPFRKYGKRFLAIKYVADFLVVENDGTETVIDIKGLPTETAKMKRKLFDYNYPDKTLKWLVKNKKYGDEYGWIDIDLLNNLRKKSKKK